jgi:hypothetical protein
LSAALCIDRDASSAGPVIELNIEPQGHEIAPGHQALAIQVQCSVSEPSAAGEETHSLLFEQRGARLVQVFSFMRSRSVLDRVSQIDTSEESVLSVLASQQSGYFSLKLYRVTRRTRIADEDESQRTLEVHPNNQVFEWNGSEYLPTRRR